MNVIRRAPHLVFVRKTEENASVNLTSSDAGVISVPRELLALDLKAVRRAIVTTLALCITFATSAPDTANVTITSMDVAVINVSRRSGDFLIVNLASATDMPTFVIRPLAPV